MRIATWAVMAAVALLLSGCYYSTTPLYDVRNASVDVIRDGDLFVHWLFTDEPGPNAAPETRRCERISPTHRVCRQEANGLPVIQRASMQAGVLRFPEASGLFRKQPFTLHMISPHRGKSTFVAMARLPDKIYYGLATQHGENIVYYEPIRVRALLSPVHSAAQVEQVMHAYLDGNPTPTGVLMRGRP